MTIAYSVNAGNEIHGVFSSWQRVPRRHEGDGTVSFTPLAINTWEIPRITAANFETLQGLQGQALTSLETNDIDDRDTGATYTTVILQSVEGGEQVGQNIDGASVRFEVQVS